MKFEGIKTDAKGLIKLIEFLNSDENQIKFTDLLVIPAYKIETMKTDIIHGTTKHYIRYCVSVNNVDLERGKEYTDRVLELIKEISID